MIKRVMQVIPQSIRNKLLYIKRRLLDSERLVLFLYQLSYVFPKKKGLVTFWPLQDQTKFGGNLKPVFLELAKRIGSANVVWITQDIRSFNALRNQGYKAVGGKLESIFHLLRAHVIVIDTVYPAAHGFPPFAWGRFHIAQLWHGTGFKEIGFRHAGAPNTEREIKASARQTILIPATSEEDRIRKSLSFATENVFVTGNPRNDVFFDSKDTILETRASVRKLLGIPPNARIILYAPTFRDHQKARPFTDSFPAMAQERLARSGSYLVIKKHPLDHGFVPPAGYERIIDASKQIDDTQKILIAADVLVTDYSGIVTDFVLMRKPVVFYLYDLEDYVNSCRNFYYDFFEIIPGPFAKSESDMLALADETSWFEEPGYIEKFMAFVKRFHMHTDNLSTERVVSLILSFMQNRKD